MYDRNGVRGAPGDPRRSYMVDQLSRQDPALEVLTVSSEHQHEGRSVACDRQTQAELGRGCWWPLDLE